MTFIKTDQKLTVAVWTAGISHGNIAGTVNTEMIIHMLEISKVTALFPLASLT